MLLAIVGLILYIVGAIGLLIDEFRESIIWGLFGLFTQVSHFLFALLYFSKCKKSLGYMLLGIVLIIFGAILGI